MAPKSPRPIRSGILDAGVFVSAPEAVANIMPASLAGAALWLLIASSKGWPVSTTHSIVGAIAATAAVTLGADQVRWDQIQHIAASWLLSPLVGGVFAFLLMTSIRRLVLEAKDPAQRARLLSPIYFFLAGFLVAMISLYKGLKPLDMSLGSEFTLILAAVTGLGLSFLGISASRSAKGNIEEILTPITLFTLCAMAFAHGSNDVANSVAPFSIILGLTQSSEMGLQSGLPAWVILAGAASIVVGLATFSSRVVRTIGMAITPLTPCRAFSASLAAAATVVLASRLGMPVSTTHTVVGAVIGVGLADNIRKVNGRAVIAILGSWAITLPSAAGLSLLVLVAIG